MGRRMVGGIWILLVIALVAGCGSQARPTGRVTLGGNPFPQAHLTFQSKDDPDHNTFYSIAGEDGEYRVDYEGRGGMPSGEYQVKITGYVQRDGSPIPAGEEGAAMIQDGTVSSKAVMFEKTLPAGETRLDFEMNEGAPFTESEE